MASTIDSRPKILVVDDNLDAAELLEECLVELGYTARRANNGAEALKVVEDFTPDIALLDIGLPVMSGFELAAKLRERPSLDAMRMVAITGYGMPDDLVKTKNAGFHAHIVKPLDFDELSKVIGALVKEARP